MDGKTGPVISIKVTESLKIFYDELTPEQKKKLKQRILDDIEIAVHESRWKRGMYIGESHRED